MKHYLILLTSCATLAAAEVPGRLIEILESTSPAASEQHSRAVAAAETEAARQIEQTHQALVARQAEVERAHARAADAHARVLTLAQATAASSHPPTLPRSVSTGTRWGGGRGAADTVVIRFSEPDAKSQAELEEDLAVMARVLDKAVTEQLGEERRSRAMGIEVLLSPASKSPRAFYLEDYGAIFLLSVPMPFLPPPEKAEPAKDKPETDAAWEEARQELYGTRPFLEDVLGKALRFEVHGETWPEYDAKKVEDVKKALLEALKNARNIRGLSPGDTITLCVSGGPGGDVRRKRVVRINEGHGEDKALMAETDEMIVVKEGERRAARGSLLTVRVKKADVDAFAVGELDLTELEKRAKIAVYPGSTGSAKEVLGFGWAP